MISGGNGLPLYLARVGLLSNRSNWLGAPAINMKMTRLALGAKCGDLGAVGSATVGDAAADLSAPRREPRAMEPRPTPHWRKNQRRVTSLAYSERSSV